MKEPRVKDHVVNWLSNQHYHDIKVTPSRGAPPRLRMGKRGRPQMNPTDPDVRGRKGTTYYFIEVKGDPPTTQKIYQAIGEICTKRASTTPKICCIAFPKSFASKLSKILPFRAWKKLEINILIVGNNGEVTEYAPTEANLEKIKRL